MEYDSPAQPPRTPNRASSDLPPHIELVGWSSDYYQAAAELIHESYIGHIDARINDQYCSLHGSLRFLHNIVRFPGCGVFDAEASWVLRDQRNGALIGMLLCSRVADDVAHITQLCVATAYRRPAPRHRAARTLHPATSPAPASPPSPSPSPKPTTRPSSSTRTQASSSATASTPWSWTKPNDKF